jgi:hypothetical protein
LENIKKLALLTKDIKIVKSYITKPSKRKVFPPLYLNPNQSVTDSNEIQDDKIMIRRQMRKTKMWSKDETLHLVFLVDNIGLVLNLQLKYKKSSFFIFYNCSRNWAEIASNYSQYFNERDRLDLCNKYQHLEKSPIDLEILKAEAHEALKNEVTILKKQKITYLKWTEEEKLYLVLGKILLFAFVFLSI